MFYPLFGSPYTYHDAPEWKVDRHLDRWLAYGQAEQEEREWQEDHPPNESS